MVQVTLPLFVLIVTIFTSKQYFILCCLPYSELCYVKRMALCAAKVWNNMYAFSNLRQSKSYVSPELGFTRPQDGEGDDKYISNL